MAFPSSPIEGAYDNGHKHEAIKLACMGCSVVFMGHCMKRLNPARSNASIYLPTFSSERQNLDALLVVMIASGRFFPKC